MFRIGLVTMALYTYGAPQFDMMRPAALDLPVKQFKIEVDQLLADTGLVLKDYRRVQSWQHVRNVTDDFQTMVNRR
jgi:hypothetical protein